MKLGIMQPYFFPYLGYFDLIYRADQWVVFDTAQYIRHGWVNRNRILHPQSGWQYIIVPLKKHGRETPIQQIEICDQTDWRRRIAGQILHYKKHAPYFTETFALVQDCLRESGTLLSRHNVSILGKVCAFLDIPFVPRYYSEMSLDLGPVQEPGDWALRIAEALRAAEYINPPGGADLFDSERFAASGIKLTIQRPTEFTYDCRDYEPVPALSIIDVLMWNSRDKIKGYLGARRRD